MRTLNYIFFFVSISFFSCEDKCEYYRTYTIQRPLYETKKTIRDTVDYVESREINNPGKLNYKDGFIFISDFTPTIFIPYILSEESPHIVLTKRTLLGGM